VVVVTSSRTISIKLVQSPRDTNLTVVVKLGTAEEEYPASKDALGTFVANADTNPSVFENRLKGPVSAPATVSVINTVIYY